MSFFVNTDTLQLVEYMMILVQLLFKGWSSPQVPLDPAKAITAKFKT